VSCRETSKDELDNTIPVRPPTLNKKIKPNTHIKVELFVYCWPCSVLIQLKILIPVGMAMIIVAAVKYARVSKSIPTVNMWCAQTIKPKNPIVFMAYTIPRWPKAVVLPDMWMIVCEIIPNPGKIRTYTSGCPKNQKRCWYRIGSPPPAGSKKEVFRFRSSNNMVIAPARTGRAIRSSVTVIKIDQTNSDMFSMLECGGRMLIMVVIKLMAPKIEEIPAI